VDGAAVGEVAVGEIPTHRLSSRRQLIVRVYAKTGLAAGGSLHLKEGNVDTTTLLLIIVIVLLLGGGGWYGRGRWY
jgi:hypothetical protein